MSVFKVDEISELYQSMSLDKTDRLVWFNMLDTTNCIIGVAVVKKGFVAQLHLHEEAEDYYFLWGVGRLALGDETSIVRAPKRVHIPGNLPHAMTPLSQVVILVYTFAKGPFKNIRYRYLNSKL